MKLLYLLLLIITFTSCDSLTNSNTSTKAAISSEIDLKDYEVEESNGYTYAKKYSDTGEMIESGALLNGKKEGAWTTYQIGKYGGLVHELKSYRNGQLDGISITLDNFGRMEDKTFYKMGVLDGTYTKYKNGKAVQLVTYKDNKMHGINKSWYQNGKVIQESNYVNGKKDGVAKYYNQEGQLTLEYTYKHGELVDEKKY